MENLLYKKGVGNMGMKEERGGKSAFVGSGLAVSTSQLFEKGVRFSVYIFLSSDLGGYNVESCQECFFYMICTRQYSVTVFPMAFTSLGKSLKIDNGVRILIK